MQITDIRRFHELLIHLRLVAAHCRGVAVRVGDDELIKQLDVQITRIVDMEKTIVTTFSDRLLSALRETNLLRKRIETQIIANAQAVMLESRRELNPTHWNDEDVLEAAILYRRESVLVDDPNLARELRERGLQLARLAQKTTSGKKANSWRQKTLKEGAGSGAADQSHSTGLSADS